MMPFVKQESLANTR